jgi:hypothetical protein
MAQYGQLVTLSRRHRDLEQAIQAMENSPSADYLSITRLKKEKLWLKDTIANYGDERRQTTA